jgi:macrolide transport system ATP-binding/permease protein
VRPVLFLAGEWVLAGIGLGLLCSIAATKAIGSMLFGVRGPDATTYAAVVTLVAAVVAIAAYLPARRAAFVDPMMLLKRD